MVRLSVIGCGNMGSALIRGFVRAGHDDVIGYDVDPEAFESLADLDVSTTTDPDEASDADIVFLVVKPDLVTTVLKDLSISADQTVVSIAAGVPTSVVEAHTEASVVRLMPNLAAEWGSMAGAVTGDVTDDVRAVLADLGAIVEVDESRMNAATALNGSGPAFVFYLIQSMAAAGVDLGFETSDARTLAAQTFKGAAETVLEADESLDALIDAVCSPKGTTIEGMKVLRSSDIDETVAEAVFAAERRANELAGDVTHE